MSISNVYSSNPLDRGEKERRDERWILDMTEHGDTRFLLMKDLDVSVNNSLSGSLAWITSEDISQFGVSGRPIFLGLYENRACYVVDISGQVGTIEDISREKGVSFADARAITEHFGAAELGIVAQARSQVHWHNQNSFCSICGNETFAKRGGQMRQCSKCEAINYPRTDPVVITVVSREDWCLLGRSQGRLSRAKRYSALAGFVDQAESIEEAVVREVMEESGISVKNIQYHSSQPWPFPYSLMIGCHADAVTTDIVIDREEMADVRWFHRTEVLLALDGQNEDLIVPGPMAIAHQLIKAWALRT